MNKSVFVSMLSVSIILLVAMYVLKFFFPQEFVFAIENENIVAIGRYIDANLWADYLLGVVTSFLTYWLYLCAVCRKKFLNLKECAIVLLTIGLSIAFNFVDIDFVSVFSYVSLIALPFVFKCNNIKALTSVFCVHIIAQYLSLTIRNLPVYMTEVNSFIIYVMTIDCYFWLLLFYIIFNYKKEEV